ncbi:hypothetical protein KPL71_014389 [Citrus sinensis]|uniref:Uncharacterized protein n=1 Tax=Citrus sinensis TaxID=2711 RepID=A0ACB8KBC6_CITSI|nr:hypothetical protein KPL71_014389 [Citrus sinensis]
MASTSSSNPSTPVTLSSTLSLPKSCTSHTANKIEHLVEYSYIPESAQISESSYPLISPYQLYKRPSSITRSIRTLISTRRPHPKEYIQSSRLDQCSLQATPAEQYVTLEIPSELISNWKREGYTHLHLGGIRLILTLHGRKGLPVTARLAMLDTRFKQYPDAVIGTVLTTIHAGSVLLTFYPNFNLSLQDPNLPTTLKVQIQIQGAEQISSAKIATLYHQLVYRLQNHALDLPTPEHHSDTLMVLAESDQIPTIIQIPRQIPRHELIKLMPLEWISNYEQFHNNTAPIQTSESMFERRQDGTVRMTFKPPPSAPQEPPRLSYTYSSMIIVVQTAQEDLPITGFNSQGYLIYPAKHNGHFLWDAPGSGMCDPTCPCWDDWEEDDDYATTRKKKPKKKKPSVPYPQRNVVSKPFIPSPITSTGHLEPPKPFESVLNWQTQNARAQNDTLLPLNSKVENISLRTEQIETKVDSITAQMQQIYQNLQSRISQLDSELRAMLAHQTTLFTTSPPIPSIGPTYHPFASMLSPIKQYDPSKLFDDQTSDSNPAVSDSPTETDTESSVSTSDSEKSYADITKILMAQPDQPTQGQTSHPEPYVDIPSEVEEDMPESSATNQPPPTQPNPSSQKSSNDQWFTFDDLPSHKWRDRLNEMSAWIDLQMLRPGATTQSVLREFATRFTGALRDWFDSLGQYRQLQFVDLPEVSSALAVLHDQFLGDPSAIFEAARRDYLNMKCCSLNAKDLDFHYKRMSLLFYKLNGFNEPTLKHVFLASLPEELQPNIQRQLTASNLSLDNISLGKIFQLAKTCLDKFCEQKQFFKELLKDKEPFPKSRKPYRFFRKKSSSSREFKRKQSSRCFICKRKGHYAKDCPNKREKSIWLVEHLQATTDYSPAKDELEFYFSEQDEPNDETVFALQNSSDSDSDQSQVIFHQQSLSLDTTVPIPSIKVQILPSKFQTPIPAIGLIDTGAQRSMLNPHILPSEYWTQSEEHFKAVNGKLFTTSLITKKPIGIQIFPNCVIWTKVIGSTLPNKDILLGFDILHQIKNLQIIPTGIRVKSMFKPFTDILKLYNLSETPQSYQDISTKLLSFCPESHSEFTHPNPLWKNKSFFIKLPFKLNEDINPTKATHPGMSPSDLLLAQQECSQLLAQGSHDEHRQLLTQFYDLIQSHGIMLSAKKSIIATDNVEFLDGKRILQTDASDDSWGAILLEELNDKEHFIAYASGHFSDTQKHYYSVFKEILAVKNGIKKFEYHLIGHHFLIRMDSSAFPNIFHFKGLTLDPTRETTEDVLWPYLQHPDTKLFWTQDQVYEWFTAPHIAVIENDIQDVLHNYLCQLNHQPPPLKDISHTSLGPQHDLLMIPTPSAISKPKSTGIIIKEEKPDYTDFLFQDSQDPWDAFLPLSQHLHQFPQPTMDEPGPSEPGPSTQSSKRPTQPSKVDKATQTSPKYTPKCTPRDYNCPYPPCRGPHCKHPKLSKTFFPKSNPDNPYETESSSEDEYMNLRSP